MNHGPGHAHHLHPDHDGRHRPPARQWLGGRPAHGDSLTRMAFLATLHCLSGCAIGEVLGMLIGTAIGLSNLQTISLAIALAFVSGYLLTMWPLLRSGMDFGSASKLALAADTVSITIMEIVDNAVMLAIPGAMDAPLSSPLFWGSLAFALVAAGLAAWPINRWLIARGRGHAAVHGHRAHR